jgi:hypothetical protein
MLIPTLFVGFMSGGIYPPPWLAGRNLFTDPDCIRSAALLAQSAAKALAPSEAVLAYDLSNEINVWCNHLPKFSADEAVAWQREMVAAIRSGHRDALVMNGTNNTAIIAEMPWDLRTQARVPMDVLSMHVYPVRNWNPLPVASLASYDADVLAPVHVAMARAYGPVMMQEFGFALPLSGKRPRDHLFQSVIGCRLDGSSGFLMWGWQDFTTKGKPYRDNPFEKEICFRNARGEVKESGRGFSDAVEFIRDLDGFSPKPAEIGIYLGDAYWEGPNATLNNSIRCFRLSVALRRAHLAHEFTERLDPRFKAIIVPGPRLNLDEIAALHNYHAAGGCILLANIGWNYWCDDLKALADVDLVDMAVIHGESRIRSGEVEIPIPSMPYFSVAVPRNAAVKATIGEGDVPALLISENGRGRAATLFAPLGVEICEHPAGLMYDQLLGPVFAGWGIAKEAEGLPADVEARLLQNAEGDTRLVLLNHSAKELHCSVQKETTVLQPKGAAVIT